MEFRRRRVQNGILRFGIVDAAGLPGGVSRFSLPTQPNHAPLPRATAAASPPRSRGEGQDYGTAQQYYDQAQALALIHFGADRTEQWMLVRIKKGDVATGEQNQEEYARWQLS